MNSPDSSYVRARELLARDDSRLLIVDVQGKLTVLIPGAAQMIANCRRLIRGAKLLGVPVSATEQYPRGLGPTVPELAELLDPPIHAGPNDRLLQIYLGLGQLGLGAGLLGGEQRGKLRLGLLLEQVFPSATTQMVSSVINPAGTGRQNEFSRTNEYIFFLQFGGLAVQPMMPASTDQTPVEWEPNSPWRKGAPPPSSAR